MPIEWLCRYIDHSFRLFSFPFQHHTVFSFCSSLLLSFVIIILEHVVCFSFAFLLVPQPASSSCCYHFLCFFSFSSLINYFSRFSLLPSFDSFVLFFFNRYRHSNVYRSRWLCLEEKQLDGDLLTCVRRNKVNLPYRWSSHFFFSHPIYLFRRRNSSSIQEKEYLFYVLVLNENVRQAPVVKTLQWWRKRKIENRWLTRGNKRNVLIAALRKRSAMIESQWTRKWSNS